MKLKKITKKIYQNSSIVRNSYFTLAFIYKNKYLPNFNNPVTYNEKINFRKKYFENNLFSTCSDKIEAKNYVARILGDKKYIIENYFTGKYITERILQEIVLKRGDCFIKANHNSGPVFSLNDSTNKQQIKEICFNINDQLKVDFGKLQNERWYSKIPPQVLIEKKLSSKNGEKDLKDYKFHVFKQKDNSQIVLLHVDFNRSSNHNRSYFDEHLNWLPFSSYAPALKTEIEKPKNYDEMLYIAKKLAEPFSYVRVDLYNINGKIYFGELTFAPGSGCSVFSNLTYDYWMGNLWQCDPRT